MANPVQPLTPAELAQQELEDIHQSWFHRDAVAFDQMVNTFTDGPPDETISSRMARWATEDRGFKRAFGSAVCASLDKIEPDHGAKAEVADMVRGERIAALEAATPTVKASE